MPDDTDKPGESSPNTIAMLAEAEGLDPLEFGRGLPPALRFMIDDQLFERIRHIAKYMSAAQGMIPDHLLGKPEACFAVITRAITWRLDPYAVAQCTYQTPGGRVGYEGKLIAAILRNSGKLLGPLEYEHEGDWEAIAGKFSLRTNSKGKQYPVRDWTLADAKKLGLAVTVLASVRGEVEPRSWKLRLDQCFPMNSTLWATDPKTQICYTATRRFASIQAPELLMGVPFDVEDRLDPFDDMKDVTPASERPARPARGNFTRAGIRRGQFERRLGEQEAEESAARDDLASSSSEREEADEIEGQKEPEGDEVAAMTGGTMGGKRVDLHFGGEPEDPRPAEGAAEAAESSEADSGPDPQEVEEEPSGGASKDAEEPSGEDSEAEPSRYGDPVWDQLFDGHKAAIASASSRGAFDELQKEWQEYKDADAAKAEEDQAPVEFLQDVNRLYLERARFYARYDKKPGSKA